MSKRLNNKRALLTAAGQGIGRATAIAMVREGAHVFATDINGETLADLQREAEGLGTIETFTLDVTDNDAVVAGSPVRSPIFCSIAQVLFTTVPFWNARMRNGHSRGI